MAHPPRATGRELGRVKISAPGKEARWDQHLLEKGTITSGLSLCWKLEPAFDLLKGPSLSSGNPFGAETGASEVRTFLSDQTMTPSSSPHLLISSLINSRQKSLRGHASVTLLHIPASIRACQDEEEEEKTLIPPRPTSRVPLQVPPHHTIISCWRVWQRVPK
jgi:hypothetical protein